MKTINLLVFIILCSFSASCQYGPNTPKKFSYEEKSSYAIYIPIFFEGKKFLFLFDTGTQYSFINYPKVSQSVPLDTVNIYAKFMKKMAKGQDIPFSCGRYDYNLGGDFEIKEQLFFLYGTGNNKTDFIYDSDGIIGMDIISKYDWSFDFTTHTVILSKKGNKELLPEEETVLKLKKNKNAENFTVNLLLNDNTATNFVLNTGLTKKIDFFDYHFMGDMLFTDSLYHYLNKQHPNCINVEYASEINLQIIQLIKLDNHEMHDLSAVNQKSISANTLTAGFLKRFDKMYYNSKNNELLLYKKNLTKQNVTDERKYIIYIKKATLQGNAIDTTDVDYYKDVEINGTRVIIPPNEPDTK